MSLGASTRRPGIFRQNPQRALLPSLGERTQCYLDGQKEGEEPNRGDFLRAKRTAFQLSSYSFFFFVFFGILYLVFVAFLLFSFGFFWVVCYRPFARRSVSDWQKSLVPSRAMRPTSMALRPLDWAAGDSQSTSEEGKNFGSKLENQWENHAKPKTLEDFGSFFGFLSQA